MRHVLFLLAFALLLLIGPVSAQTATLSAPNTGAAPAIVAPITIPATDYTLLVGVIAAQAVGLITLVINTVVKRQQNRHDQPYTDTQTQLTFQSQAMDIFRESNALHQEDAKTIAAQAGTITTLTTANSGLLARIDGLPQRIAEQVASSLVKDTTIKSLRDALLTAGVHLEDQPVAPKEPSLTPLIPPSLLQDLAHEKAAMDEITGIEVDPLKVEITNLPKLPDSH